MQDDQIEICNKAIFDINWSHDGTTVAAGFESNVVILNMRRLLSVSPEAVQGDHSSKQNKMTGNQGIQGTFTDFNCVNGNLANKSFLTKQTKDERRT